MRERFEIHVTKSDWRASLCRAHYLWWKVLDVYPIVIGQNLGAIDGVLQLTDIARPTVSFQSGNHIGVETPVVPRINVQPTKLNHLPAAVRAVDES